MLRCVKRIVGVLSIHLVIGVTVTPSSAQDFVTKEYSSTAYGPTVIMPDWKCWYSDCKLANCHMDTVQQPSLGKLKVKVIRVHLDQSAGYCAGAPIAALQITYVPRPGVHGQDEVVMRSIADNGGRHMLYFHIAVP